ncbi:MAG: hypothetical protein ACD_75C02193G0001 [uncultured bacterium]|nr:MAG: hypothetical protein ACD_75C02193G0001 [uncultured bacterium]
MFGFQEGIPPLVEGQQRDFAQFFFGRPDRLDRLGRGFETEPVETVGPQRDEIREIADRRKLRATDHLHRNPSLEFGEVQFRRLNIAGQIGGYHENLALVAADEG